MLLHAQQNYVMNRDIRDSCASVNKTKVEVREFIASTNELIHSFNDEN